MDFERFAFLRRDAQGVGQTSRTFVFARGGLFHISFSGWLAGLGWASWVAGWADWADGYWLLAKNCWVLGAECLLVAAGCWLLAGRSWRLAADNYFVEYVTFICRKDRQKL